MPLLASPPPPHGHHHGNDDEGQRHSERVLWISSRTTGTLRMQIRCVEVFHGELLNDEKGAGRVDRTGLMLWPASYLMAAYLMASRRTSLQAPAVTRHVVDLGSGACALAGLLLSHLVPCPAEGASAAPLSTRRQSRITLTDGDKESLGMLEWNARHHHEGTDDLVGNAKDGTGSLPTRFSPSPTCDIHVQRLRWGNPEEAQAITDEAGVPASLVLGSDVLYPSISLVTIQQLLQSARALLLGTEGSHGSSSTSSSRDYLSTLQGCLVLSFIDRDQKATLRLLMGALRYERFQLEQVVPAHNLYVDADEGFAVLEEDEEEGGEEEAGGHASPPRRRQRRVQLMTGGMLLVLRPVATGDASSSKAAEAEAHWFPDLWTEAEADVPEEWAGPPLSSGSDDEDEEEGDSEIVRK